MKMTPEMYRKLGEDQATLKGVTYYAAERVHAVIEAIRPEALKDARWNALETILSVRQSVISTMIGGRIPGWQKINDAFNIVGEVLSQRPAPAPEHPAAPKQDPAEQAVNKQDCRINRFKAFNPEERNILLTLLQEHCNAVSQIAAGEHRVASYLAAVEELEKELQQ